MFSSIRKFITQSRAFAKFLSIVACLSIGFGLWGHQHASVAQTNIVDRLGMLRSTSPESGVRYSAAAFDVSIADTLIADTHNMSEICSMAAQSTDPELAQAALDWGPELEEEAETLRMKRKDLIAARLDSLRSTSPESGVEHSN